MHRRNEQILNFEYKNGLKTSSVEKLIISLRNNHQFGKFFKSKSQDGWRKWKAINYQRKQQENHRNLSNGNNQTKKPLQYALMQNSYFWLK